MTDAEDLVAEITHCPVVEHCRSPEGRDHPCREIVSLQDGPLADFQVPEPWAGRLDLAPLLFVSSNPSISTLERYPRWNWELPERIEYFQERFGPGRHQVRDGILFPLAEPDSDGRTHGAQWVRFWAATRSMARVLHGRQDVDPGRDYALTEVVHCKSLGEKGVAAASGPCAERYLLRTIRASPARVIAVLGAHARDMVAAHLLSSPLPPVGVQPWTDPQGVERVVLALPHPNHRGPRRLDRILTPEQLETVSAAVRGA